MSATRDSSSRVTYRRKPIKIRNLGDQKEKDGSDALEKAKIMIKN
jgi:hypothetical protein